MRTAYEAICLERPLVVTDTKATRQYFPYAVHTENTGPAISKTVQTLLEEPGPDRISRTTAAAEVSRLVTAEQMNELRSRIAAASRR
jgi:hypothetical protein